MFEERFSWGMSRARDPEPWLSTWQASMAVSTFRAYAIGCSFIPESEPDNWYKLADDPRPLQLVHLELEQGLERERAKHNASCLAEVRKTRRTVMRERSGHSDLFVPVGRRSELSGILACGPVLTRRPTLASLEVEWRKLGGATAAIDNDGLVRYARAALTGHVFEGPALHALTGWLEAHADTMAGLGPADDVLDRSWRHRATIRGLLPETSMWQVASELVDRDRNPLWTAAFKGYDRIHEGIARIPSHVVAVAPSERADEALHPVERMLRVDRLQRLLAVLAAQRPNTLAGRLGEDGAFVLVHAQGGGDRVRSSLTSLAERIAITVRRRLGFDVVSGISERAAYGGELPERYDQGVRAVLMALSKNQPVVHFDERPDPSGIGSSEGLYQSSRALSDAFASGRHSETTLAAQQVVRDVLWVTGGHPEAVRSHFIELVWELLAITDRRHIVDRARLSELLERSAQRLEQARSTRELTASFTRIAQELSDLIERPSDLERSAKLERARRFIE
jgi:hypothetical protein